MRVTEMYDPNACSLSGRNNGLESWTWDEVRAKKSELGESLVLVDMINHPVPGSVPISEGLFSGSLPAGTVFALYCHSGGSSGHLQAQLAPIFPQYRFVNVRGGVLAL